MYCYILVLVIKVKDDVFSQFSLVKWPSGRESPIAQW